MPDMTGIEAHQSRLKDVVTRAERIDACREIVRVLQGTLPARTDEREALTQARDACDQALKALTHAQGDPDGSL